MRKSMGAVLGSAAAIVLVGGAGLATAAASPAGSAASGTEHFSLMTTQPTASKYVIITSGVFTAGGTDVSGAKTDTAKFHDGTFKIHHGSALHITKQKVNPKTCLAQFAATVKFTLGGGTGAYKGISGSGTAKINALEIAKRNSKGACNLNAAPAVNEQTITATAHVKV
jgi:hypothetical protein